MQSLMPEALGLSEFVRTYFIALFFLGLFAVACLYSAAYFAWVTATPMPPEQLPSVRFAAYAWFGGFVLAALAFVGVTIRLIGVRRADRRSVLPSKA